MIYSILRDILIKLDDIQTKGLMIYQVSGLDKKSRISRYDFFGAGSRGRTDTVLLPSDFESDASANSTIPAWCVDLVNALYYTIYF